MFYNIMCFSRYLLLYASNSSEIINSLSKPSFFSIDG